MVCKRRFASAVDYKLSVESKKKFSNEEERTIV